jgi:DNA-binding NarL/FixJ family response regulator
MRGGATQPTQVRQLPEWAEVRVLIIDDNPSFTDLLSSALSTVDGIECVGTASSAAEGLLRVREVRPSVVLMDIMMPGLDGLSATRQLRQFSPGTAVAVVSAYAQGEWIARAADAGASAYIPKGGSLDEIVEVLRATRPGPMIVAPSLSSAWAGYKPLASGPPPDGCPSAVPGSARPWLQSQARTEAEVKPRRPRLFGHPWRSTNRVRGSRGAKNHLEGAGGARPAGNVGAAPHSRADDPTPTSSRWDEAPVGPATTHGPPTGQRLP